MQHCCITGNSDVAALLHLQSLKHDYETEFSPICHTIGVHDGVLTLLVENESFRISHELYIFPSGSFSFCAPKYELGLIYHQLLLKTMQLLGKILKERFPNLSHSIFSQTNMMISLDFHGNSNTNSE